MLNHGYQYVNNNLMKLLGCNHMTAYQQISTDELKFEQHPSRINAFFCDLDLIN